MQIRNFLTALAGFFFLITCSVVLVLNLREIYYYDIEAQGIVAETGLSEQTIRENYDILIDYNLITKGIDTLEFPDFPMSESGRIHFEEVKKIFVFFQYGCIVSAVFFLAGLLVCVRKKTFEFLKYISLLTPGLPLILGILAGLCWEQLFTAFHRIFFRNDYWLFDPVTDPVILILPDAFFFHCAAAIILFLLLASVLSYLVYRILKKRVRLQTAGK